jgi:hypothetical protein
VRSVPEEGMPWLAARQALILRRVDHANAATPEQLRR